MREVVSVESKPKERGRTVRDKMRPRERESRERQSEAEREEPLGSIRNKIHVVEVSSPKIFSSPRYGFSSLLFFSFLLFFVL